MFDDDLCFVERNKKNSFNFVQIYIPVLFVVLLRNSFP